MGQRIEVINLKSLVALVDLQPRLPDTDELRERIRKLADAVDGLPEGTYVSIKVTKTEES